MKRPHLYKHSHLVMILDTCHAGQVNSADYQFEKNQTSKYPQFSQKVDTSQVASTSLSLSLSANVSDLLRAVSQRSLVPATAPFAFVVAMACAAFRVALVSQGTRGDTQPFLALAKELERRGHEVAM